MSLFENLSIKNLIDKIDVEQIIKITIIFVIGFLLIRIIRFITRKMLSRTLNKQSLMLVHKFITYAGYSILFIMLLSEMGIQLTAILGAAGILGLAIGVASCCGKKL
jgi:small-conductance mechanosensitive channel